MKIPTRMLDRFTTQHTREMAKMIPAIPPSRVRGDHPAPGSPSLRKRGFTLLEILVSLGIIAIVGVLLTQAFVTSTKSNTKGELTKEVKQNGDFALQVMTRLIQNALKVTSPCPAAGSTDSSLTLTNFDGGSTRLECRWDSGVLRIASTSAGVPSYLTNPEVTLTGGACATALTFTCTTEADETKSVKINFTIAQKGTPPDLYQRASASFQTTVSVRN